MSDIVVPFFSLATLDPRNQPSQAITPSAVGHCKTCRRDFKNAAALNEHLEKSARHKKKPPLHDHSTIEHADAISRRGSDDFTNIFTCLRCGKAMMYEELDSHSCVGSVSDGEGSSSGKVNFPSCPACSETTYGKDDLLEHWRSSGCRKVCEGCSTGIPDDEWKKHCRKNNACFRCHYHHTSRTAMLKHIRSSKCPKADEEPRKESGVQLPVERKIEDQDKNDHVCPKCREPQLNKTNLQQHLLTHRPVDQQCWGCERLFSTVPGIIIHLESGACPSGTCKEEMNGWAADVFQWRRFIEKDWVRRLKNRKPVGKGELPFFCEGCDTTFGSLSALFQHCANGSCSQGLSDGAMAKLQRWLVVQLKQCR